MKKMTKISLFFLFILIIVSCSTNEKSKKNKNVEVQEDTLKSSTIISTIDDKVIIRNDKFAVSPFGKKITWDNKDIILKSDYQVIEIPKFNEEKQKLEIFYLWTNNQDSIIFYKIDEFFLFNTAILKSSYHKLNKEIKIGMTKKGFLNTLEITNVNMKISEFVVQDEEEYSEHTFYFNQKNILEKIELFHVID